MNLERCRRQAAAAAVAAVIGVTATTAEAQPSDTGPVRLMRLPAGQLQPMARADANGAVHLIYFNGEDPSAGNAYYVHRPPDAKTFSDPLRVNSQPGSVIAIGTVRGAHLALGADGRPHVAWMGSSAAEPTGPDGQSPMLYSRLVDGRFEPQRNLVTDAFGLDGGGTLAADASGRVAVLWHADAGLGGEENRRIWMTTSTDDGATFSPERAVSEPGVCGCCGMSAAVDATGTVRSLYRGFAAPDHRDMYLATAGATGFDRIRLEPWRLGACPMSTSSMMMTGDLLTLAWETAGEIAWATLDAKTSTVSTPTHPSPPGTTRKHPALARAPDGGVLLVWTEGMGWNRGGTLHWQHYDSRGDATAVRGTEPDVPVWSRPTVIADDDGQFTIFF